VAALAPRQPKVLIVEDRRPDAEMMVHELEQAGLQPDWTWAQTRDEFLAGLRTGPDLILCDNSLPDLDARSALALMRAGDLDIPLIIVSGSISERVAVACMREGASDYVLKDRLARLGSAALRALERKALADGKLRAEAELLGSERLFRQLVEQLPAIVYLWEAGAEGECYYVSPAIESILGYPVREWLADSKLWASRIHPEDRESAVAKELRCRETGEDLVSEYRMFARDGRLVWIRDEAVMVRDEDGSLDHLRGLMYDISAEKQGEASLRRSREETIRRLSRAAEFRDDETGAHIERMSRYCELIGMRLGLDPRRCEQLRIASPMHDVGKIGVADAILRKPGPLDPDERAAMERHAEIGYRILAGSGAELLDLAATIARTHHERYDGTGYPRRLKGEEIPLEGRIAAVADVFDALTTDRVYRPAYSFAKTVAMMRDERGSHFDPVVLDSFLAAERDICKIMVQSAHGRLQGAP
jgi:PAS domain S-box-containing protein